MAWQQLIAILGEVRSEAERQRVARPVACPECGEPLTFHASELHCPFCGTFHDA